MNIDELKKVKAPFSVVNKKDGTIATIKGFAQNDPLGVGGGIFPDIPVVYFEGGGWILVDDLLRHYDLRPEPKNAAAQALRAIQSDKRTQASRENGKKGGRPKNRICPFCEKSVSVYRHANGWYFSFHRTNEKDDLGREYQCNGSYANAE